MFLRWRTTVHRECSSSATGMPMPYGAQLIARARRIVLERGLLVRRLERKPVHALGVSSLFHFWGTAARLRVGKASVVPVRVVNGASAILRDVSGTTGVADVAPVCRTSEESTVLPLVMPLEGVTAQALRKSL